VLEILNNQDFDYQDWDLYEGEDTIECPLCATDVLLDDVFVLSCNDSHKICYTCLYKHCFNNLNIRNTLSCPIGDCDEAIHLNELISMPFPKYMVKKLSDKYEKQLLANFAKTTEGVVRCPACEWVAILDIKERYNVKCGNCSHGFCTKCRKTSHYRVECNEVPKLTAEWMIWCNIGRKARRNEVKTPKNASKAYKKANKEVDKLNKNLVQNFSVLKADEEHKEQTCKHCPNCDRIVEKLDGCNIMKCGEDYHENEDSIQNGCGENFDWNFSKPYESQIGDQPSFVEKLALSKPKSVEKFNHNPYKCDACKNDIIGIRFECINCECTNFCEDCEVNSTLELDKDHVFKLNFQRKNECILQ
jgi:hypothetical protein